MLGAVLAGDVEGPFAGGGGGGEGDAEPFAGGDAYQLDFAVGAGGELAFLPAEVGAVAEVAVFAADLEEPIGTGLGHDIELDVEGAGVPSGGVDVEDGIVVFAQAGGVLDFEAALGAGGEGRRGFVGDGDAFAFVFVGVFGTANAEGAEGGVLEVLIDFVFGGGPGFGVGVPGGVVVTLGGEGVPCGDGFAHPGEGEVPGLEADFFGGGVGLEAEVAFGNVFEEGIGKEAVFVAAHFAPLVPGEVGFGELGGDFAVGGPVEVFAEDEAVFGIAALGFVEELPVPFAAIEEG